MVWGKNEVKGLRSRSLANYETPWVTLELLTSAPLKLLCRVRLKKENRRNAGCGLTESHHAVVKFQILQGTVGAK